MAKRWIQPPAKATNAIFREWFKERTGVDYTTDESCTALGLLERDDEGTDQILAVMLFHTWTPNVVELSMASRGAAWTQEVTGELTHISKFMVFTIYDYAFRVCDKARINGFVDVTNHKSISIQIALGHSNEGRVRDWFGEGHDAFVFGYTRKEFNSSELKKEFDNV